MKRFASIQRLIKWVRQPHILRSTSIATHAENTRTPVKRRQDVRTRCRRVHLAFMVIAMVSIFLIDTATSYEVAISVFYTVVILTAARVLNQNALVTLTGVCIGLTFFSFFITSHGDFRAGLLNLAISIIAISITGYLTHKMEATRAAAHDAQAQLLRIARVKSLEGLTTSIAHEVNQPLAAIVTSGHACQRWLLQEPENLERARLAIERILSEAGRASNIIARVRSLTKGDPPHKASFAFNDAISEIISMFQDDIDRACIALTVDLAPNQPRALADRVQIQQVIANLILNAIEATLPQAKSHRSIQIRSHLLDEKVVFSVSDTGVGLPVGIHKHLFEAFWTTKKDGIGVGLSLSRAIIEANEGLIWASSNDHTGAVFSFSLPLPLVE